MTDIYHGDCLEWLYDWRGCDSNLAAVKMATDRLASVAAVQPTLAAT